METTEKDNKYFRAKDKVEGIKKFYTSLISYIFFICFLAAINYWTDQWRYPWFLWAAFGWGIGLVFQAFKVFDLNPLFGRNWEERKIKEFMQEDEKQQKRWK
ncbi:2TM domain-containing protein [Maribacter polysaccharolyticus]|uniref:2TM domain-containing protein n=1 Tax=Maribacter polysaccharolyticus TaxID=3020831 RepID=UPI00237F2BCA|nr:2TM domain-containing protein [Maribacter polysaccharolyticus]MDE3740787.1 2TM domain-containing protein [Maribacter polysaccharolyticus]